MTPNRSRRQEAFAELVISDLDPDDVTRRLGINPDDAHRKGDPTPHGAVWKVHHWRIRESEVDIPLDAADFAGIVVQCLDRLLRRISDGNLLDRLTKLSREVTPDVGVYGYCCEVPNLYYSPDVIRTIARIGASLGEDFYAIYGPTGNSPEE